MAAPVSLYILTINQSPVITWTEGFHTLSDARKAGAGKPHKIDSWVRDQPETSPLEGWRHVETLA